MLSFISTYHVALISLTELVIALSHDDVIKWKHFPRYWPFARGIHRSLVNSQHKGQWRGALMFSLICVWINGWENNREAGDLRRYRAHYDVTVMIYDKNKLDAMLLWLWRHHDINDEYIPIDLWLNGNQHICRPSLVSGNKRLWKSGSRYMDNRWITIAHPYQRQ